MNHLLRMTLWGCLTVATASIAAEDDDLAFAFQMKASGAEKATSIAMYDDVEAAWRQAGWKGAIRIRVTRDAKAGAARVHVRVGTREKSKLVKQATLLPNEALTLTTGTELDEGYLGPGVQSLQLLYTGRVTP